MIFNRPITDADRLEWLIEGGGARKAAKVMGSNERGWSVCDCSDGLTFISRGLPTMREAIDAAMVALMTQKIFNNLVEWQEFAASYGCEISHYTLSVNTSYTSRLKGKFIGEFSVWPEGATGWHFDPSTGTKY
jgi:hypothetical protein